MADALTPGGAATPGDDGAIAVEILHTRGCASLAHTRARLATIAREEGVTIAVRVTRIETDDEARVRRFAGSPTVRVEGRDVDPGLGEPEQFGLG